MKNLIFKYQKSLRAQNELFLFLLIRYDERKEVKVRGRDRERV